MEQRIDSDQEESDTEDDLTDVLIKDHHEKPPMKEVKKYSKVLEAGLNTEFLTRIHPDNIEKVLLQYLT